MHFLCRRAHVVKPSCTWMELIFWQLSTLRGAMSYRQYQRMNVVFGEVLYQAKTPQTWSSTALLWLGSLRHRKVTLLILRLSEETIYALGVHFSYEAQLAAKERIFWSTRLPRILRILSIMSSSHKSIYGRINLVRTIAV